jgi:hypothetical protein
MKKVCLILCLFVVPAISQTTLVTSISGDPVIFKITFKPESDSVDGEVVYGAIVGESGAGKYLEVKNPDNDDDLKSIFDVHLDTPGAIETKRTINKNKVFSITEELPHLREKRYKEAGYTVYTGANGVETLLHQKDRNRLKALVRLQEARDQGLQNEVYAANYEEAESAGNGGPSFATLWGRHLLTVLVAGISLVIVWKACF